MDWYCSKSATKVLNALTAGLNADSRARKFDNAPGAFMPVSVEFLYTDTANGGEVFSIAHYFEQNGDLMRDPEMTFLRKTISDTGNDLYYYSPLTFTQDGLEIYLEYFDCDATGKFISMNTGLLRDAITFSNQWMQNISNQQSILF